MKKTGLVLLALTLATTAYTQTAADYETAIGKFQKYYNQNKYDSAFNLFSAHIKSMMTPDQAKKMLAQLNEQSGFMQSYNRYKQDDRYMYYKAVFSKDVKTLVVALDKEKKLDNFSFVHYDADTLIASNIKLATKTDTIYGTLTLPEETNKKVPVVLIIAGSGATDRNGNDGPSLRVNTYLMLADSLKKKGIASLRYDKRGVGASKGKLLKEEDIRFEDEINDAAGFIKMLKEDSRFSKVIVLGHSEGSLTGMIAANKENPAGFISVSGPGQRIDKIIEQQLNAQSKDLGDKATVILDNLLKGNKPTDVDQALASVFRPSSLPYLMAWLKYDPQQEIKKLSGKVLIIQGATDIQVSVNEAKLLKKAKPDATLDIIEGMNHILKDAPADRQQNIATYSNPVLPLNADITPAIVKFINTN